MSTDEKVEAFASRIEALERLYPRFIKLEDENAELKEEIALLKSRLSSIEGGGGSYLGGGSYSAYSSPAISHGGRKKTSTHRPSSIDNTSFTRLTKAPSAQKSIDHKKDNFYYVCGKRLYVEVPEPYQFGQVHKTGPSKKLVLEYAYGYNIGVHDNLVIINDDEIAYCLAGVAVVSSISDRKIQRFFRGHTDDVTCISKCPTHPLMATGQVQPKDEIKGVDLHPYLAIWNYNTMKMEGKIDEFFSRGVALAKWTTDGKYMFAVGEDDGHLGGIFDMSPVYKSHGHTPVMFTKPIAALACTKDDLYGCVHCPDMVEGKYAFATYGSKVIAYWTYDPSKSIDKDQLRIKKRVLSSYNKTKISQSSYNCAAWVGSTWLLTGCPTGHIYVFDVKTQHLSYFFDTGKSAIMSLAVVTEAGNPTSKYRAVCQSGVMRIFDSAKIVKKKSHKEVHKYKLINAKEDGKILSSQSIGNHMLISTTRAELIHCTVSENEVKRDVLMRGNTKEIWALATHPKESWICVGCDDKVMRIWDFHKYELVFEKKTKHPFRTADFSRDGSLLALGATDGTVTVIDLSNDQYSSQDLKVCKEEVSAICFSKDGSKIVLGSWDQYLHILKKKKDHWKVQGKAMKGHTSSITHLTLSEDGRFAQSCSKDVEVLYWDVEKRCRIDYLPPETLWDRWNAIFGWPVQGLFHEADDPTDVNACHISGGNTIDDENGEKMVVSGDDSGHVTLFKYPILEQKPTYFDQYLAHSAHVTNVRWSETDGHLFSVGGGDLACFQWRVEDKN